METVMESQKLRVLLTGLREVVIVLLGHLEDYLDIPYDISVLAKRREKVRK